MMPAVYFGLIESVLSSKCRKEYKTIQKMNRMPTTDGRREHLSNTQRRAQLANEALMYFKHLDEGGSVISFAVSMGWNAPLVCHGRLDERAAEWIDSRWIGRQKDVQYCDECGEAIKAGKGCAIASLPCDIDSANEGESAFLCAPCFKSIQEAKQ